jgi:hypothetical protein
VPFVCTAEKRVQSHTFLGELNLLNCIRCYVATTSTAGLEQGGNTGRLEKGSIRAYTQEKKDRLDCNNYRGISLLCHYNKLFTSNLLQRLKSTTDEIFAEEQAGFRAGRSTTDQIFTLRQLAEKNVEFSEELYICYIDFRKAFNSPWRRRRTFEINVFAINCVDMRRRPKSSICVL